MSAQSLSQIIRTTVDIMIAQKGDLLTDLSLLQWLDRQKLEAYAQAIHAKGAAINNCWGFIDGTARAMCRPSINQEQYYSGHKKFHCLKYQGVLCPDGIITSLMGGFPGRRHDAGIFRESNLYQQLEEKATATLRVAVEWGFSKIILQSLYKVSVLLTNAQTCLYGSQTADYFNLQPPSLEEYFKE